MRLLRRRRLPPELRDAFAAFGLVVELVERAKDALTGAVPTTRAAGRPLPDALSEFEEGLRQARDRMREWRRPEVEGAWLACASGIDEALASAERLRIEAPKIAGFEGVIGALDGLLAPLERFEEAFAAFRAARVVLPRSHRRGRIEG
jgi:hypothetical protein